jgi:hypothetical protein
MWIHHSASRRFLPGVVFLLAGLVHDPTRENSLVYLAFRTLDPILSEDPTVAQLNS